MLEPKTKSEKITVLTEDNVSTQLVAWEIKNWPSILVELFRSCIMYEMKTKRFDFVKIESDDRMLVKEAIELRMKSLQLPSNAKTGDVLVRLNHNKLEVDNPININTSVFKLGINEKNLCVLGKGKYLTIEAVVVERSYHDKSQSCHTHGYQFIRSGLTQHNADGVEFSECQCMDVEYNSGIIEFVCPNIHKDLLKNFNEIIMNTSSQFVEDFTKTLEFRLGKAIVRTSGKLMIKFVEAICLMSAAKHGFDVWMEPTVIGGRNIILEISKVEKKNIEKLVIGLVKDVEKLVSQTRIQVSK